MPDPDGLIVGLLLAAGAGRRFGGGKLLATLPDGRSVAVAACAALAAGVDQVVAVVRPGDAELHQQLRQAGAFVLECPSAEEGMGASLAYGIARTPAAAWVIGLADMPFVEPSDVQRVAQALRAGAPMVAMGNAQEHGHPVGFSSAFGTSLAQLTGDRGARALLRTHAAEVVWLRAPHPASQRDIDTVADWLAIAG